MVKKSKRLNSLLKRKSVIKKTSIQRKSKRNIRFIKRGGEINIQEVAKKLNEITEIRDEKGDFEQAIPLKEFQEGLERDPVTRKFTEESLEKLLAYHQAKGTGKSTDLATWVNFGKQQILGNDNDRDISRFTDEIIMILLKDYDLNSTKMIFMNNIFDLKPSMIQQYLPSNMWSKFGGVTKFTSWISKLADPILSNEPEAPAKPKRPMTKDILSIIMTQLKDKYPGINSKDRGILDLILKDLFKKIYYLKNDKSSEGKLQQGGGGGLAALGMVMGGLILVFIKGTIDVNMDVGRTNTDIGRLREGLPASEEKTMKWREKLEKSFQNDTIPEEEKVFFGFQPYDQTYRDAYANYRLKQIEQTRVSDIDLLTRGIRPSSLLFDQAERGWKGQLSVPERAKERSTADSERYRDAFIGQKVGEYESGEAALRNQMDKDNELKNEAEIVEYERIEAKLQNQLDEQRRKDLVLMSQGKRPTSAVFKEADRLRLRMPPLNESAREIATSDVYQQEYKPYQAKKTSDKVFNGLFSGFGF